MDFIKIFKLRDFFCRFCIVVGIFCQLPYKSTGKSLSFRVFIKSAVDQKRFKLGVVIAWTTSIVQNNSVAIATCLEELNFLPLLRNWSIDSIDHTTPQLIGIRSSTCTDSCTTVWENYKGENNCKLVVMLISLIFNLPKLIPRSSKTNHWKGYWLRLLSHYYYVCI